LFTTSGVISERHPNPGRFGSSCHADEDPKDKHLKVSVKARENAWIMMLIFGANKWRMQWIFDSPQGFGQLYDANNPISLEISDS
jgi:hypothetical protein